MTTTVAPYRSDLPVGRDGFAQLLLAEFTKFRTVRAWVNSLGVTAVLIVLFAWVGSHQGSGACSERHGGVPICTTIRVPPAPLGPDGEPVVDTFSFLHQPLIGNGSLTAQIISLTEVRVSGIGPGGKPTTQPALVPWAKAGIMVSEKTTQGSAYAAVLATPSHGVRMQYNFIHDTGGLPGRASASSPRWLRLTRAGDVVTGYDSLDGINWTKIATVQLTGLPERVEAGVLVTSPAANNDTASSPTLATATFDQVHLAGGIPNINWSSEVVGANTETYPTLPTGPIWFRKSAGAFTISGSGDIAPQVAGGALGGSGDTTSLLASAAFGLIAVSVLATLFITSEYRRGLIRTTLTASPRRGRVVAAKAAVIGLVTLVTACIATGIAEVVSRHMLAAKGNYVFPLSSSAEVRVSIGTGLLFAAAAILILALATMLRHSAGAVVIGIVLFVLPFVISHPLSPAGSGWLFRITPAAAFAIQGTLPHFAQVSNAYTLQNGYYPLAPWAGLAVLVGYAAVALAAAMWSIRRRDL